MLNGVAQSNKARLRGAEVKRFERRILQETINFSDRFAGGLNAAAKQLFGGAMNCFWFRLPGFLFLWIVISGV